MARYILVMAANSNGKTVVGDLSSDDRLMGYLEAYHSYDKGEWLTNWTPRKVLDKLFDLGYKIQSINEVSSEWSKALAETPSKRIILWTLFKEDDMEEMMSRLPIRRESRVPAPLSP